MIRENDIMMSPDLVGKISTASSRACDEELRQLAPPKLRAVMRRGSGSGSGCGCAGAHKRLLKRLSLCEPRDAAWERRRRLMMLRRNDAGCWCGDGDGGDCGGTGEEAGDDMQGLTDEDLSELKGSIELGFGFNEEDGQALCETLPALDLYFAVNRQFSPSPVSTPKSRASTSSSSLSPSLSIGRSSPMGSPRCDSESWKICSPGDDPQQVKTKIRHWAQAVACSLIQSYELINQ